MPSRFSSASYESFGSPESRCCPAINALVPRFLLAMEISQFFLRHVYHVLIVHSAPRADVSGSLEDLELPPVGIFQVRWEGHHDDDDDNADGPWWAVITAVWPGTLFIRRFLLPKLLVAANHTFPLNPVSFQSSRSGIIASALNPIKEIRRILSAYFFQPLFTPCFHVTDWYSYLTPIRGKTVFLFLLFNTHNFETIHFNLHKPLSRRLFPTDPEIGSFSRITENCPVQSAGKPPLKSFSHFCHLHWLVNRPARTKRTKPLLTSKHSLARWLFFTEKRGEPIFRLL